MAASRTLLCIHRDPAQLSPLQDSGYELVTATNGSEGLRLFMTRPVDAILLEYHLGLLDGGVVAEAIKQVRPTVPIVMLSDDLELPDGVLNSVDALVTRSDGTHFLWATVNFVLSGKPAKGCEGMLKTQTTERIRRLGKSEGHGAGLRHKSLPALTDIPFSAEEWKSIRRGTVRF
jgi:DNA-binding response OmpR family regulator